MPKIALPRDNKLYLEVKKGWVKIHFKKVWPKCSEKANEIFTFTHGTTIVYSDIWLPPVHSFLRKGRYRPIENLPLHK